MDTQNSEMIVKLNSTNAEAIVTLKHSNGTVVEKCISVEDLMSQLAARHSMSTGILPPNTRFFKGDHNHYVIVLESPAKLRTFSIYSGAIASSQANYQPRKLTIPFPNCVLVCKVSNKRIRNVWVFSSVNKISTLNDGLCCFPFGNIYEDGHVCWGSGNTLPEINSPLDLVAVSALFFDSPFNGDLTHRKLFNSPTDVLINNFWELVNYLDGKTFFPPAMLYSASKSLNSVIQIAQS